MKNDKCAWVGHYSWDTGCGNVFYFDRDMDDLVFDGDFKFCPFCGKPIDVKSTEDELSNTPAKPGKEDGK